MYRAHASRNAWLSDYESILVDSTGMYSEYERNGVRGEKLQLVPLPLTDMSADNMPPPARPVAEAILFVGRLTDLKGVDYLIRAIPIAARKLGRRLTLTIAGDGPDRSSLEKLAGRLGVEVRFTGWLQSEAKYDTMRQADLLAVPSLWPEPFGMVGIEAGCLGLPAVGYAVGGIPDWLLAGETGEIAPGDPPTVEGLADAMVRALADPSHYMRLRRGAFEASHRFSLERHMAKLEPILRATASSTTTA
jgi:glycosyltransferase involved in cell wall biosynthesis